MSEHLAMVFSNQQGVAARVCPRGAVALSVGHTSLQLRKEEFLKLAQVIRAVETRLSWRQGRVVSEPRH